MMKVKVLRAIFIGGEPQPIGTVLDIDTPLAVELIAMGKIEMVVDPDVIPEVEPAKAKRPVKKASDL